MAQRQPTPKLNTHTQLNTNPASAQHDRYPVGKDPVARHSTKKQETVVKSGGPLGVIRSGEVCVLTKASQYNGVCRLQVKVHSRYFSEKSGKTRDGNHTWIVKGGKLVHSEFRKN